MLSQDVKIFSAFVNEHMCNSGLVDGCNIASGEESRHVGRCQYFPTNSTRMVITIAGLGCVFRSKLAVV
jgi:hypothetical protein